MPTRESVFTRNLFMALGFVLGFWNGRTSMSWLTAVLVAFVMILVGLTYPARGDA